MATIWFGEPARALLPLGPLWLTLLLAAAVMRLCSVVPALRPLARGIFTAGVVVTALIFIHSRVFPDLPAGDWGWLASFGDLASLEAERPHAELGLIALSFIIWLLADGVARNGGELSLRRANFLGFFAALVVAIVLGVSAQGGSAPLTLFLALAVPLYVLCGLLMLAQVRLAEMRDRTARSGVTMGRALWIWRLATAGLVGAMVAVVFALAAIFYGGSYRQFIAGVATVWDGVITVVATIVSLGVTPFAALLTLLIGRPSTSTSTTTKKPTALPDHSQPFSTATAHTIYTIALIGLVLIVVLVVAFLAWQRIQANASEPFDETRERLAPQQGSRIAAPASAAPSAPPPAGSVRVVYRTLLRRMAKLGLARDPDETPAEYAARLTPHLGSAPTDDPIAALSDLTTEYQNERYGGTVPTPSLFARAQAALRRLLGQDSG